MGFWIIIAHLIGAYLLSSDYVQNKAKGNTVFSLIAALIYIIPFILFLPTSILFLVLMIFFRFAVLRFRLVDYILWAKNRLAPREHREQTKFGRTGLIKGSDDPRAQLTIHVCSLIIHCIFARILVIFL